MKTTPLIERARELARVAHAGQRRKSGGAPYFHHLEAVAEIVAEHGHDDEVTIAAAYLHDLLEDQPAFASEMTAQMPREVVAIVEVLSETKLDASGKKRPKAERFADYVVQLGADTEAARRAVPVSCADKVHNLRSIVESESGGDGILARLATRPGEHGRQIATLRPIFDRGCGPSLLAALDETLAALDATIHAWLPGRAVMIAAEAHLGQRDKAGAPYIEHPMRVMLAAEGRDARIVAALHDVVEDSAWTLEDLAREGFSERVIAAVDRLTRREGEDYEAFIERVAVDPLARAVKQLDLEDNADLSRIPAPTDRDRERVAQYRRALARLRDA